MYACLYSPHLVISSLLKIRILFLLVTLEIFQLLQPVWQLPAETIHSIDVSNNLLEAVNRSSLFLVLFMIQAIHIFCSWGMYVWINYITLQEKRLWSGEYCRALPIYHKAHICLTCIVAIFYSSLPPASLNRNAVVLGLEWNMESNFVPPFAGKLWLKWFFQLSDPQTPWQQNPSLTLPILSHWDWGHHCWVGN